MPGGRRGEVDRADERILAATRAGVVKRWPSSEPRPAEATRELVRASKRSAKLVRTAWSRRGSTRRAAGRSDARRWARLSRRRFRPRRQQFGWKTLARIADSPQTRYRFTWLQSEELSPARPPRSRRGQPRRPRRRRLCAGVRPGPSRAHRALALLRMTDHQAVDQDRGGPAATALPPDDDELRRRLPARRRQSTPSGAPAAMCDDGVGESVVAVEVSATTFAQGMAGRRWLPTRGRRLSGRALQRSHRRHGTGHRRPARTAGVPLSSI